MLSSNSDKQTCISMVATVSLPINTKPLAISTTPTADDVGPDNDDEEKKLDAIVTNTNYWINSMIDREQIAEDVQHNHHRLAELANANLKNLVKSYQFYHKKVRNFIKLNL